MLIAAPDFQIGDEVRILALQGDLGLEKVAAPDGGRLVVDNPGRAHEVCKLFLDRMSTSDAHIALIPELAIPIGTIPEIIATMQGLSSSMLFLGGIEGLTRTMYESMENEFGANCQTLSADATDNYINALLIIIRTPSSFVVAVRAKRVPSRWESLHGPPMATGSGPFVIIQLGSKPLTVLPLICSEFVWPQRLWELFSEEIPQEIQNVDLIPVLQHNSDVSATHTGQELHRSYTGGNPTNNTRYIFANQALSHFCDGACYVIVPPTSQHNPAFDHACYELWQLPGTPTYKGFRIPDLTGCIWSAQIMTAHAGASALGTRICAGRVREVLVPSAAELTGLVLGLMRSEAARYVASLVDRPKSSVREEILASLDRTKPGYILGALATGSAKMVFYELRCGSGIGWNKVESVVAELIEGAGLLTSGGDLVQVTHEDGTNCNMAGRPVLFLHSPDVDEALAKRFSPDVQFDGAPVPAGVLLLGVMQGPSSFDAKRIGDVLRADIVTSNSENLSDFPQKEDNSSVTARVEDVEFRSLQQLRKNVDLQSLIE